MPVHVVRDGHIEAQLPSTARRIQLRALQLGANLADTYLLGQVSLTYPSSKLGNGLELFKFVLEDPSEKNAKLKAINTFIFGKMAVECGKAMRQGDTVVVFGFDLTKSPSVSRDGRHRCQIELSEEKGSEIYILNKSGSRAESTASGSKYSYTTLDQLKEGMVANLFGVVKFFKPPYRSKGTDYCSAITIVDPSDVKLKCMLFSGSTDTLPKVYKIGDIVRFHRIKIQSFHEEIQGITTAGFSALVFDGTVGAPMCPRTSSNSYTFTKENEKNVDALRKWAINHLDLPGSRVKLSDVQPLQYFDLICHLVAKAEVDKTSYLLKVWDGTKCVSPTWKICVEDEALEGERSLIHKLRNLTVDVLVYDNHVESAKSLKVGSCIVIHSVHTKLHAANAENQTSASYLEFYLHGGTGYGRGITVLPDNNYDAQELKKFLDTVDPKEYDRYEEPCISEAPLVLTSHCDWQTIPLATVINSPAPNKFRVRAQLQRFQPQRLDQSVKLHCTKCKSLQDAPEEHDLNIIFQERVMLHPKPVIQNTEWYQSAVWGTNNPNRCIAAHFVRKCDLHQDPENTLIMVEGAALQEIYKLSKHFGSVIPVKSDKQQLEIDLSAPFLIEGNRWHYGCRNCSNVKRIDALIPLANTSSWETTAIAEALGIEPLRHVFVMNFTLADETGLLKAYLWNYAEQFFQIPASEILMDSLLQDKLCKIMETLCPPRKNNSECPWLEFCIRSYNSSDGGKEHICYEVFDTEVTGTILNH
ncbi:protection of telomeres protein 1 [Pelobates fuscus]|uniref:protection of telomeres protein 1 n=1 Tax=Pelobates fuscus TaxID=191477 RepID=UPI002FE45B61